MNWVGLDSFDSDESNFAENVIGYSIVVIVYIVCLIYIKAASRSKLKQKFMQLKYPERVMKQNSESYRVRNFRRKKNNPSTWNMLKLEFIKLIKSPYVHLMVFRLTLFAYIFLYFAFQSLVPLILL